jgi:glycine/D-amino acid oxidase-like deaminating enzyme
MARTFPPAPRTDGYRDAVLWIEQADPPAPSSGSLPASVDVLIVGAGFCGLAAAEELARAGRYVAVLERDGLGESASCRNGGMVIPELHDGPIALARKYGPLGIRMYAEVNDSFDRVEHLTASGGIVCDYARTGQLYLAHNRAHVEPLARMADEQGGELGEDVRFVPRDGLPSEIGSSAFFAGVVLGRTGGVHPARFHAGLARRALEAGASIFDHTAARSIGRDVGSNGTFTVETDRGTVRAGDVIVAVNACADELVPWLARRVVPVGSFIIATEVLDAELAESVSPTGRMMVDTKNLLFYWRLSPDGRVLFGGRRSLAPTTIPEARDFLYASMVRIHPQLASTRVDRAWGGYVAMTVDRMPHFGWVPSGPGAGALYATGCNGSGVALNTGMGTQAARVLLGDAPPAIAELSFPAVPLPRVRRAWLPVVGQWYAAQDRRS